MAAILSRGNLMHESRTYTSYGRNETAGVVAMYDIRPKRILNLNLTKSRLSITYCSIIQSF